MAAGPDRSSPLKTSATIRAGKTSTKKFTTACFTMFTNNGPVRSIVVRGWADLLETLYADSWNERLGRFRSDFAFRGLEAPGCELHSGLMRFGDQAADF